MNEKLKQPVREAVEQGWKVVLDQGDSVTVQLGRNTYATDMPLYSHIYLKDGEVRFTKAKVMGQGAKWAKGLAIASIILFVVLAIAFNI